MYVSIQDVVPQLQQLSIDANKEISSIRVLGQQRANPAITVIAAFYRVTPDLEDLAVSLRAQSDPDFDTILVQNAPFELPSGLLDNLNGLHVVLKENLGPGPARNVATCLARSPVLCFIDDDVICHPKLVEAYRDFFNQANVVGARGKVIPKSPSFVNRLAPHYNLGDRVLPYHLSLECNVAIRRKALIESGGWHTGLWGYEGTVLSQRLVARFGYGSLFYNPSAIVYHDFASSFRSLLKKTVRFALLRRNLIRSGHDPLKFQREFEVQTGRVKRSLKSRAIYGMRQVAENCIMKLAP